MMFECIQWPTVTASISTRCRRSQYTFHAAHPKWNRYRNAVRKVIRSSQESGMRNACVVCTRCHTIYSHSHASVFRFGLDHLHYRCLLFSSRSPFFSFRSSRLRLAYQVTEPRRMHRPLEISMCAARTTANASFSDMET